MDVNFGLQTEETSSFLKYDCWFQQTLAIMDKMIGPFKSIGLIFYFISFLTAMRQRDSDNRSRGKHL